MKLSVKRDGRTFRVTGAAVDIKYLVLGISSELTQSVS